MVYSDYISKKDYTRSTEKETISEDWFFEKNIQVKGIAKFYNNIQGTALYANHGDIAEVYKSDEAEPLMAGTLVKFGGKYEITKTDKNDRKYFGVISTAPGVILNDSEKVGEKIALMGRVPVRTIGKINKFDKLTTSSVNGVAKRKTLLDTLLGKPTIGISLENNDNSKEKLVEVFIKAFAFNF